jgi:hypothetical protein
LTPAECTTLRRLAVEQGLQPGYVDSDDGLLVDENGAKKKKKMGIFDRNEDGRLSVNELIRMVDDFFESHVSEQDIKSMLATINLLSLLEESEDETISIQDFIQSDTAAMRRYFKQLIKEDPSKRSRHSEMAWLSSNAQHMNDEGLRVMDSIRQRVALLTRLPEHVVHQAMEMQVVHYEPAPENKDANKSNNEKDGGGGGHYTAHFDSLPINDELPCCHITNRRPPCRACRMATVLYNLSDMGNGTGGGGHTAFPLATNEAGLLHHQHTAETIEDWRMSSASRESSYCAEDGPGLRISPELGQAILWYNHDLSHLRDNASDEPSPLSTTEATSPALLGDLDRSTIHAGCPASKPHQLAGAPQPELTHKSWDAPGKWIANHWIEASNVPGEDEEHYELEYFVKI